MNIILLISDTFRYDNLFDRASMPVRTPCLDAFTQRAVSLEQMLVSSFPTIPHRTDVTTGRFGWPWYAWQPLSKSGPNHMPKLLSGADYVTQLICDCPHLFRAEFNQGFDGAYQVRGQESDIDFVRMNNPLRHVQPPEKNRGDHFFRGFPLSDISAWINHDWRYEDDRFPAKTGNHTIRWLEDNYRHHPFFLWVDFFDPHEPWDPPEYMVRHYDPDAGDTRMVHPNYGKADDLTPEELRNLRAHYCAESELVDRWVGRVLQKIDDLALWDDTIVIFTADHGMSLGEHNRTGKSNINDGDPRHWPIYPEIARVPFLVAAPGLEGGHSIDALVQPPDILPTVLDLAGVDVEPPEPFHGQSFAPMLRGEAQAPLRNEAVAACFMRDKPAVPPGKACTPVLYTRQWAYAPLGPEGEQQLFDLASDPYAETNVAADHPDRVAELRGQFFGWMRDVGAPAEAVAVYED